MTGGEAATAPLRAPLVERVVATKPKRHLRGNSRISVRQASNMMEAVAFAKSVGVPLVAHVTIHWSLTDVGDDPNGRLLAKVREGLDKWLTRRDIVFAGAWTRERQCRGQSDVEHCHLLFHLPVKYHAGKCLAQVRLHSGECTDERVIKLVIHDNPDGKYLIKGGGPKVWKKFHLLKEHRRVQGLIFGKRCGVTENIGGAARKRWKKQQGFGSFGRPSEVRFRD